jgi:hypothetical protein
MEKHTKFQNSVRKTSFGGIFSFPNCHIIELDTGSLVLIVFGTSLETEEQIKKDKRIAKNSHK